MSAPSYLSERVRFGAHELNIRTGELISLKASLDGAVPEKVLLREQPFLILRTLIERQGKVVSRQEIRNLLWPNDTIVDFDRSINVAIALLRKALADDADRPKYIETLARRGYRLIAPVEWQQSSSATPAADDSSDPQAVTNASLNAAALVGKRVSHYRVLEILGGGGMGVVYKAEDLRLDRRVALKFLPEELANEPKALARFETEAKAASALNHPNICTIYGIEEHEHNPFIVMELLEGEALSTRLSHAAGPLPVDTLLKIAIQICDGLEAAHAKGVIHRDIKPANIFLTAGGPVKILDFGLAKLAGADEEPLPPLAEDGHPLSAAVEPSSQEEKSDFAVEDHVSLTITGTAVGTASYMSPEQIRKEKLDARTDLFSFGLILYEMATGRRAFEGQTIEMVHDAILHRVPTSARHYTSIPRKLERAISKALEKDRARRYQSASEIRKDLLKIQEQIDPRGRLMRRSSVAVGLALLFGITAWGCWRIYNSVTLLPADTIVLADLDNQTGDAALTDGATIALQVALFQTPYLNLLGTDKVHETLRLLHLPEDTNVTVSPVLARQVCEHTHSRAIISGSITDLGNRYGIELKALNCKTGRAFAKVGNEAENGSDIIRSLGRTALQLRAKLREPKESLAAFNQPLERATSSSPDALQFLASGYKSHLHGDLGGALRDYRRSIEKDPSLALAYAGEASAYASLGDDAQKNATVTRAFELREGLTLPSRYQVETLYYGEGQGAWEKEVPIAEQWARTFPHDVIARINLSTALERLGRCDEALAQAREAARLLPSRPTFQDVLLNAVQANHFDEANTAYQAINARHFDSASTHSIGMLLAFLRNDESAMNAERNWAQQHPAEARSVMFQDARTAAFHGRLRASLQRTQQLVSTAQKSGDPLEAASYEDEEALRQAEAGNLSESLRLAAGSLKLGEDYTGRLLIALVFARAGNLAEAQKRADALARDYPDDILVQKYSLPAIRAAVKLRQNDPAGAIEILRPIENYDLAEPDGFANLYPAYIRGLAFLQMKQGNQAAAEFQKLLDHPGVVWVFVTGALAHLQLARAQAMTGDYSAARKSYQDFLTLWKDADPDLPAYKEAKTEYALLPKPSAN